MNAVIYARYSTGHDQTERSIEGQLEDCYKYAAAHNLRVVGEYIDRKISGTADNRKDFQRMIKESASGHFDVVLVWKLDRFARNRYDSANYRAKLKMNGVTIISATEAIPDSPEGIMLEALLEGMAEYYSKELSVKVKRGIRVAKEKGEFTGGHLLFGYALDGKKVKVNEDEAPWVKYIFEQYAAGATLKDIISVLNNSGLKPRIGTAFSVRSFQNSIHNRKYLGDDVYPAIISPDLFEKVQNRINARKRAPAAEKARVKYQLQGKIFCGYCGSPMVGESGKGKLGTIYNYYTCANKKKNHACNKRNEKKDFIEWYVVEQTMLNVLTDDKIEKLAVLMEEEYRKEFNESGIVSIERQLSHVEHDIDGYIESLVENRGNKKIADRITAKIDELEDRKAALENDLYSLKMAISTAFDANAFLLWMKHLQHGDPHDLSFRQTIIDTFINAIYLYDDKVIICYNSTTKSEQISYIEISDALSDIETIEECSDFAKYGGGKAAKSELLIISHKVFAIIIPRE